MAPYNRPTFEQILADLIAEGKAKLARIKNWVVGGVIRTLLAVVAKGLDQLYTVIDSAIDLAFPDTSYGVWLALIARLIGLEKKVARKAEGRVILGRNEANGAKDIPKDSVVATVTGADGKIYRFKTKADDVLPAGETEVEVEVIAESVGKAYNVGAGTITEIVSSLPGIDYVRNEDDWLDIEGTDTETDDELRERIRLRWAAFSYGGTAELYQSVALGIDGVMTVVVNANAPRGDGTLDVIITGSAVVPTQNLIDAVQAAIDAVKPKLADVLVKGPTLAPIDVTLVGTKSLAGGEVNAVLADLEDAVEALFLSVDNPNGAGAFQTGQKVVRARFAQVAMQVAWMANVDVVLPDEDVLLDGDELAQPGDINLSVVGS